MPLAHRDHPRMCGEHAISCLMASMSAGSSPHVRGAHQIRDVFAGIHGIIPACAGSTSSWLSSPSIRRDHPRMCGEHMPATLIASMSTGSSPHVRGARRWSPKSSELHGIIPACAGSTSSSRRRLWMRGDHPRMCGEHMITGLIDSDAVGSSPHVRGALRRAGRFHHRSGIIPACAGSTSNRSWLCMVFGDHPRMCGEHEPALPPYRR